MTSLDCPRPSMTVEGAGYVQTCLTPLDATDNRTNPTFA